VPSEKGMVCPDWVPTPAWGRLEAVLDGQPEHAADALADLEAACAGWPAADRARLLERFLTHAERGLPLPAAFIVGLGDLVDARD
jgi:hypothetical protein